MIETLNKIIFAKSKISIINKIIVIFGFVALMSIILPYGWREECVGSNCGVFFADRYRARDEFWHMSMSQVSFAGFPFKMPIFAGSNIQAYHFLFALLLFLVTKTGLSVLFSFYVVLPVLWFLAYTILTIRIANRLFQDRLAVPIFLFFSYFSSNLTFVLSLKNHGQFWNDIGYFSNQPGEYMINPGLAFSILIFQVIILLLLSKNLDLRKFILMTLMTFLLWGTKFYGAIIGVSFMGFSLLFKLARKELNWLKFCIICSVLGLVSLVAVIVFYNPFGTSNGGGVFAYDPFKTIHAMIEDPELWQMRKVALARYYLYSVDKFFLPKLWSIELGTLFLYLLFSFGTRSLSFLIFFEKVKNKLFYLSIFLSALISIALGTLLVQKGTDWFNTIQFLAYGQYLLQISLSAMVYVYVKKGKLQILMICFVIGLITFLGALNPLAKHGRHLRILAMLIPYERLQAMVYISKNELNALAFMKKQPGNVVFVLPFEKTSKDSRISELWKSNDTAYLSALSGKQVYIANTEQLELMFINYKERQKIANNPKELIKVDSIDYYYLLKEHPMYDMYVEEIKPISNMIFENESVRVYRRGRKV